MRRPHSGCDRILIVRQDRLRSVPPRWRDSLMVRSGSHIVNQSRSYKDHTASVETHHPNHHLLRLHLATSTPSAYRKRSGAWQKLMRCPGRERVLMAASRRRRKQVEERVREPMRAERESMQPKAEEERRRQRAQEEEERRRCEPGAA